MLINYSPAVGLMTNSNNIKMNHSQTRMSVLLNFEPLRLCVYLFDFGYVIKNSGLYSHFISDFALFAVLRNGSFASLRI